MKHKALTILLCLFAVLLILSGSIALPIYFRPFYYWQINPLQIPAITGYDRDTVIAAYDEVLDYLTLPGATFGTGVFPHTPEGASHFADCRTLFAINTAVLFTSLAMVVLLSLLCHQRVFRLWYPRGRHVTHWIGSGVLTLGAVVSVLVAVNVDQAFEVFHRLFFPGKENWMFDPQADAIINALPMEFFVNCGLLIVGAVTVSSISLIIYGALRKSTEK